MCHPSSSLPAPILEFSPKEKRAGLGLPGTARSVARHQLELAFGAAGSQAGNNREQRGTAESRNLGLGDKSKPQTLV